MRLLIIVACWFALVLSGGGVQAQAGYRMIMHTFQEGSNIVLVAIAESPTGPRGLVTSPDHSRKERPFTVSNAEFGKMWSTLMLSGATKYAGDLNSNRSFDGVAYYVFSAGYSGKGTNYAVLMMKASFSLVALATQFRA